MLFVIILSSASLGLGLFEKDSFLELLILILPVLLASVDLVFSLSTASQTHKFFRHRFTYIEARLVGCDVNIETINEIYKEVTQLMAEEPPVYRVLLYHCTNLADIKTNGKPSLTINLIHMRLRNIVRFSGSEHTSWLMRSFCRRLNEFAPTPKPFQARSEPCGLSALSAKAGQRLTLLCAL